MSIPPNSGFSTARWIVSNVPGQGTHTTLTAAYAAASSGDTIFLRTSITDSPTAKAGVDVVGFPGEQNNPQVVITGKVSITTNGNFSFSNISIVNTGDFALSISGSVSPVATLESCFLETTTSNTINFISTGGGLNIYNSTLEVITNGTTPLNASAGAVNIFESDITGTDTPISYTAASTFQAFYTGFSNCGITVNNASAVLKIFQCNIDNPGSSKTCVTLTNNSIGTIYNCILRSGSAAAATVSALGVLYISECTVESSAANAFTGAGSINYGGITFISTSTTNVTSEGYYPLTVKQGGTGTSTAVYFNSVNVQYLTTAGAGTYTPTAGMKYAIFELVGAGGGGGATTATGVTTVSAGGGGGGGGYCTQILPASAVGASIAYVIGAGGTAGTTSGGTGGTGGTTSMTAVILSATGGIGGTGSGAAVAVSNAGGAGGLGTGGAPVAGEPGQAGFAVGLAGLGAGYGGMGGSAFFGGGASATNFTSGQLAGIAGKSYGGGGSGAGTSESGTAQAGGAGAGGLIIVTEFIH